MMSYDPPTLKINNLLNKLNSWPYRGMKIIATVKVIFVPSPRKVINKRGIRNNLIRSTLKMRNP